MDPFLFNTLKLPDDVISDLRRMNPWWEGKPTRTLPKTRRHLVKTLHSRLRAGLAPILLVRGPRQIGKTTAQLQLLLDLVEHLNVSPTHVFRVQFDDLPSLSQLGNEPIMRLVDWFEGSILKKTLNEAAHHGEQTYLFLDELQNLRSWDTQLKSLVDHSTTRVIVTGSSALRLELGRDSLAGRITTIDVGVLSLTEIATFRNLELGEPFLRDNGLDALTEIDFWRRLVEHGKQHAEHRNKVFRYFSERGGYPLVHEHAEITWPTVADQLNETVIKRVITHDLRVGERGRKRDKQLLEEVFRLACRYVGQFPTSNTLAREAQRALNANIGPQRISHYLRFLGDTLLLRLVEPLEIRLERRRGNVKICLADHGLRASWLHETIPLHGEGLIAEPHLLPLAGRIVESVVGALLVTVPGLDVNHLPQRENDPEVDFVVTIGTTRIPIEVKYSHRISEMADTEGLRTFIEKTANNAPFGILITLEDAVSVRDPRIVCVPLSSLMLLR
jgi:predicted AAA+ superfamily ATPase